MELVSIKSFDEVMEFYCNLIKDMRSLGWKAMNLFLLIWYSGICHSLLGNGLRDMNASSSPALILFCFTL